MSNTSKEIFLPKILIYFTKVKFLIYFTILLKGLYIHPVYYITM